MGIDLGLMYSSAGDPNNYVFGEKARALNAQTATEVARGATLNAQRVEKKKKDQASKTLMSDMTTLEPGVKTLLGM